MKRVTFALIAFVCAIAPANFVRAESACPATIVVEQRAVGALLPVGRLATPATRLRLRASPSSTVLQRSRRRSCLTARNKPATILSRSGNCRRAIADTGYSNHVYRHRADLSKRPPASFKRCDVVLDHNMLPVAVLQQGVTAKKPGQRPDWI